MKLIVAGKKYPLKDAMQGATLANLYVLKIQTGVGIKSLRDSFKRMEASAKPAEDGTPADPLDFLEDAENLMALQAMVWLCKRHDGETVTVAEANAFPLSQIGFEPGAEDAEAADPTQARTATDPGEGPAAAS